MPLFLYDGGLLVRDGGLAANENCCCTNECCISPCCPVYVVVGACSESGASTDIPVVFANNSCVSEAIPIEETCCGAMFVGVCPVIVRVRAVCASKFEPDGCGVDCSYVLEYASTFVPSAGGWTTTPTYMTANGACNCSGGLVSLTVEQRLEGPCAEGEPQGTAPCVGCGANAQCCICYSSYGKAEGYPGGPTGPCFAPYQQDPNDILRCEFFGSAIPCPCTWPNAKPCTEGGVMGLGWSEADAQLWCGQHHPEANAISTVGPIPGGHCCGGFCQVTPCNEVPPP